MTISNLKKQFFSIILIFTFFLPNISLAVVNLNLDYPEIGGFDLNVNQNLNQLVAWFYYFILGIAGIAAVIMLVLGGFQYVISAGNPTKISEAKDRIFSALLGLIIILASYLILKAVNPEFLILNLPKL